jgi:DNA (cytosine-5)-methyltransferase 1
MKPRRINELALFAGAGGGILGGKLLGWRTVCAVERDEYAASVLVQRQNDGHLEPFPIWDDVCTFDGRPWKGRVDVISGGFPCQDISIAGKGSGIEGQRSGLWVEMARIIDEVRPQYAFVENSPMLTSRGLGRVLGDLASLGYDAEWGVLGAHHAGAPHKRDRIWIVATYSDSESIRQQQITRNKRKNKAELVHDGAPQIVADSLRLRQSGSGESQQSSNSAQEGKGQADYVESIGKPDFWAAEPDVGRVAHGVARRVDRLKAIGNGQVPAVAAIAFEILRERLEER